MSRATQGSLGLVVRGTVQKPEYQQAMYHQCMVSLITKIELLERMHVKAWIIIQALMLCRVSVSNYDVRCCRVPHLHPIP